MSQLYHAEEDSLASGDPPADMLRKTHYVEEESLASGYPPADMCQLQHVEKDYFEDDSLASGDPPPPIPCRHVPATTC